MATSKTAKVEAEIEKVKGKISEFQGKLRELEQKKTEIENTEIVGLVRGMDMVNLTELAAFLTAYREQQKDNPAPVVTEEAVPDPEPDAIVEPESAGIVSGSGIQYNGDSGTDSTAGGSSWR